MNKRQVKTYTKKILDKAFLWAYDGRTKTYKILEIYRSKTCYQITIEYYINIFFANELKDYDLLKHVQQIRAVKADVLKITIVITHAQLKAIIGGV